MLKYSGSQRK